MSQSAFEGHMAEGEVADSNPQHIRSHTTLAHYHTTSYTNNVNLQHQSSSRTLVNMPYQNLAHGHLHILHPQHLNSTAFSQLDISDTNPLHPFSRNGVPDIYLERQYHLHDAHLLETSNQPCSTNTNISNYSYCPQNTLTPPTVINSTHTYMLPTWPVLQDFIRIPQRPYSVRSQLVTAELVVIKFRCAGGRGLRLDRILKGDYQGLQNSSTNLPGQFKRKVSYRIEWPGYRSFTQAMNVHTSRGGELAAITLEKVAYQIAQITKTFIDEGKKYIEEYTPWQVGFSGGCIKLEDLELDEVRQVSIGSLQPQYLLTRSM